MVLKRREAHCAAIVLNAMCHCYLAAAISATTMSTSSAPPQLTTGAMDAAASFTTKPEGLSLSPSYSVCLSLTHSLLSDAKPSLFIQVNAYTRLDLLLGDPNRTNMLRPLVSSDKSLPLVFIKRIISIWVGCPCVALIDKQIR